MRLFSDSGPMSRNWDVLRSLSCGQQCVGVHWTLDMFPQTPITIIQWFPTGSIGLHLVGSLWFSVGLKEDLGYEIQSSVYLIAMQPTADFKHRKCQRNTIHLMLIIYHTPRLIFDLLLCTASTWLRMRKMIPCTNYNERVRKPRRDVCVVLAILVAGERVCVCQSLRPTMD